MRIAIQNPYADPWVAEAELSRRIAIAARHLGWEAAEVHDSVEIRQFAPDFVLALHCNSPKLAGYPTYGCMWNPPVFFEGIEATLTNILTYDGYLVSSEAIARWLHQFLCNTPKVFLSAPIYTSCPENQYQPPNLSDLRLVYLGSNWDGSRFHQLFELLDRQPYMAIYGNAQGWTHLQQAYQGTLPYDGVSVLNTLNRAGVGLCLHRDEHRQAGVPSMRIFEIVAAGAVAICGEHPFIRDAFGDSVLYIDPDVAPPEQVQQIAAHMDWIRQHPQAAQAMTAEAHQLFLQHYTLEKLLLDLVPRHQELIQHKGFIASPHTDRPDSGQVQFIVRAGGRGTAFVGRSLDSIAKQTYKNVAVLIVKYRDIDGLDDLLSQYGDRMPITVIDSPPSGYRSKTLWDGLAAVTSEYFAILDDDDTIHPNHVHSLITRLDQSPTAGVAYSGSFKVLEAGNDTAPERLISAGLAHYLPFDLDELLNFRNYITSNSYVARSAILKAIVGKDPLMDLGEDFCLLLHLCQRTPFVFSYEATSEFYWRDDTRDNVTYRGKPAWREANSRLRFMFWKQEFAPGKTIQSSQRLQIDLKKIKEKLEIERRSHQEAIATINAMQTSKFWQLRDGWFKLKRKLGLPTI